MAIAVPSPSSPPQSSVPDAWRMPSRDDFGRYVETTMAEVLRDLEKDRRKMIRKIAITTAVVLGLAPIAVLIGTALHAKPAAVAYAAGLLAIAAIIACGYGFTKAYKREFKGRLISPLVQFFGADFVYSADAFVDSDRYSASRIFRTAFTRYSGEDYIAGTAGRTRFECSEICSEYEREYVDSKGNKQKSWKTIFSGLFIVADFNKAFSGGVWVFPDSLESKLGWLAHKLQEWKLDRPGQLVKLEDPEFERLFAVYATDQMVARYVLSPSLMKRITEYRQRLSHPLWMSFSNGVLYVALAPDRDLFEPKMLSVVDREQCMSVYDDIAIGLGIIEDLNLNTRIWSKQ
jgi:hypothetical protein